MSFIFMINQKKKQLN